MSQQKAQDMRDRKDKKQSVDRAFLGGDTPKAAAWYIAIESLREHLSNDMNLDEWIASGTEEAPNHHVRAVAKQLHGEVRGRLRRQLVTLHNQMAKKYRSMKGASRSVTDIESV